MMRSIAAIQCCLMQVQKQVDIYDVDARICNIEKGILDIQMKKQTQEQLLINIQQSTTDIEFSKTTTTSLQPTTTVHPSEDGESEDVQDSIHQKTVNRKMFKILIILKKF